MGRKLEGNAENKFKKFGKKIDEVIGDLKGLADDPRYKNRVNELKNNGEKLKSEFEAFKVKHKNLFDEIEEKIAKTGDGIKKTFSKTFRKNKKE